MHCVDKWGRKQHVAGKKASLFSNKLQAFVLHIADLCLRHQQPAVERKRNDVGGDPARILLGFQGQNNLIICVGNKFK